jgi:hypothetical protein
MMMYMVVIQQHDVVFIYFRGKEWSIVKYLKEQLVVSQSRSHHKWKGKDGKNTIITRKRKKQDD